MGKKGKIYNVCSGNGIKLSKIIHILKKLLNIDFQVEISEDLIRPIDNPVIIGSNNELIRDTGFKLNYTIEQSLEDMISFWDNKLK